VDSDELGQCIRAWRNRLSPAAVGLPKQRLRRAPGLRREELSQLAGVSVDYLTRLEQGRAVNPSTQVLGSLARALRLTTEEEAHLFRVAGEMPPSPGRINRHMGIVRVAPKRGVQIADLRRASRRFEELWQTRPVAARRESRKTVEHPEIGRITLDCDVLQAQGSDLRLIVYTAEPGTPDADALALLGAIGLQELR
jgi:transcriptional regulator with XRE-family HTH domain